MYRYCRFRRPGIGLPKRKFQRPILEALTASSGQPHLHEIYRSVRVIMANTLTTEDFAPMPNGEPRWHNKIRQALRDLREIGYVRHIGRCLDILTSDGERYVCWLRMLDG